MKIPWMKSIPAHWQTLRAKNMFEKQSRAVRDEDDVVTCFRDGMVTLRKNRRTTGFTESIQWSGYQGVRKGDLVIHVMDAFAGAIGVSDSDGKSTPVYNVCTAKMDLNNHYYAYLLREMARTGFIQSLYRGIRERSSDFRFEVFAGLFLPVPPRKEQDQIVRYLDWKVSQINKLINAKQRQIALLQLHKQTTLREAFINKNSDWQTVRVRFLCKITTGNKDTINRVDDGLYPFYVRSPNIERINTYSYDGEAILMAGDGVGAGRVFHYANGRFDYHQRVYCFYEFSEKLYVKYVHYYMASLFPLVVDKGTAKSTVDSIRLNMIQDFPISFPNIDKQAAIVKYLDEQCAVTENVVAKLANEIDLITEYRACLISDVVTGKQDVYGVIVPEYEDVEMVEHCVETEKIDELEVVANE